MAKKKETEGLDYSELTEGFNEKQPTPEAESAPARTAKKGGARSAVCTVECLYQNIRWHPGDVLELDAGETFPAFAFELQE